MDSGFLPVSFSIEPAQDPRSFSTDIRLLADGLLPGDSHVVPSCLWPVLLLGMIMNYPKTYDMTPYLRRIEDSRFRGLIGRAPA